jgi:hypothetical protein
MAQSFSEFRGELRERLLRAGIAPRHVRRYLKELTDHLADLRTEEERVDRRRTDAESAALARLGTLDNLTKAMTGQPQLRSWCARAPWVTFGVAPVLSLGLAYLVAVFVLSSGWRLFLPEADSPFGVRVNGFAGLYFQVDRAFYYLSPILIGWGIGFIAARQRFKAFWPMIGMLLIALIAGTIQIHAGRTGVPRGLGHIKLDFSGAPSVRDIVAHGLMIFFFPALPYLFWRSTSALTPSHSDR